MNDGYDVRVPEEPDVFRLNPMSVDRLILDFFNEVEIGLMNVILF